MKCYFSDDHGDDGVNHLVQGPTQSRSSFIVITVMSMMMVE